MLIRLQTFATSNLAGAFITFHSVGSGMVGFRAVRSFGACLQGSTWKWEISDVGDVIQNFTASYEKQATRGNEQQLTSIYQPNTT